MDAWQRADGGLEESRIAERETLYEGLDGQRVERIRTVQGESLILKSAPNDGRAEREKWVYASVLPALPDLYPRMIASSDSSVQGNAWTLFEDLGPLDHAFREEKAAALIDRVAQWHSLPRVAGAEERLQGPKPRIERMASDVAEAWERGELALQAGGDGEMFPLVRSVIEAAVRNKGRWESDTEADVFSHGDLHSGNYAMAGGAIRVLDWEHAHWNSRFWDLYHIIDLSHPLFPKRVDDPARLRLLRRYADRAASCGAALNEGEFIREYRLFAAVFSLWMHRLIERDLAGGGGPWPEAELRSQRLETLAAFVQNAREL